MAKLFQGLLELKLGVAVGGDNEKARLPNLQNYIHPSHNSSSNLMACVVLPPFCPACESNLMAINGGCIVVRSEDIAPLQNYPSRLLSAKCDQQRVNDVLNVSKHQHVILMFNIFTCCAVFDVF